MLLLDSEALSAIAHGPPARHVKVRSLMAGMVARGRPVATVAAVLAEVIRGRPADAGVFAALKRESIAVLAVDRSVGVRAGQLLGAARSGSELAVDAFVIAVADLAGGAVVATVDPADMNRLAAPAQHVQVANIG